MTENKISLVKEKIINSESGQKSIVQEIAKAEATLEQLKKSVAKSQKEVKDLTAVRESMARKASSAMS